MDVPASDKSSPGGETIVVLNCRISGFEALTSKFEGVWAKEVRRGARRRMRVARERSCMIG